MKKRKQWVSALVIGLMAICVCVLAFCAYKLVPKVAEYQESDNAFDRIRTESVSVMSSDVIEKLRVQVSDEEEAVSDDGEAQEPPDLSNVLSVDWESFSGTDIVAWLQLDDISYPIMQSDDNDYYLHRLPDGSDNYGGSIFLYNHNNPLFTDQSSFVYGHNMANGSMFGKLKNYGKSEEYADHKFYIYLPDGTRKTYQFFSVASVPDSSETYTWSFASMDSFLEWQNYMKGQSLFPCSPEVSEDASYVTLSTCNGSVGTSYRFIICGQLIRTDTLQEPASWYEDYIAAYEERQDSRKLRAGEIRSEIEQMALERRESFYRRAYGLD